MFNIFKWLSNKKFTKRRNMKNVPEFLMYIDDIE